MPTQKQSEPKEILGLNRITKKRILELCKRDKLYQTPRLNDVLYLHYQGFQNIECLEDYTELKCLWLECNAISEIQGLENQTKLKCLYLQSNLIRKIENLEFCKELDTINLSQNQIRKIENVGCDVLPVLNTLNIASNYIKDAEGLRDLENCKNLSVLDLSNNRIDDILVVKVFAKMPELKVLVLQGNPVVSKIPQYRKTLILECKKLTYLDQRPVFPKDRACAEAWKRGGYEEERKENERWNRQERRKMRDSVNATIRLRNKYRKPEDHMTLLVSSDSEDEATQQRRQRQQDVLDSGVDMELGIWDEVAGDDGHGAEVSPSSSSSQTDVSSSTSDSKESHENAPRRVNLEIETADDKYEVLDEMEKVMKTMDTEIQEPQRKPGDSSLLPESFFQKSEEKAENNLIETTETDDDVKDILKNAPRRVNLEIETADDKYEVLDEMDKVMKTMDTEIQKPQRKPDDSSLLPESFSQKSEEKAENNLIETTETDDDVKDILKNAPRRVNLEIEIADDKYEVLDEMDKVMKTMDTEIQEPQRKPDDSSLLPESFSQKSEEKALKADNDVKDILKIIEFLREQEILEQLFSQRQENDNSKMAPKEKCPSVIVKEKSELSGLKNESNIVQQQKPIQGENLDPYVEELKMEKSPTKFEDETIALEKNLKTEDILLKKIDINPVEMQENLPDSKLETATTKTEIQKNNPIQHQNLDSHVEEFKMEKIASKYENERSSLEEYPKEEKLEKIDNNPVNLQDDNSISPDMNYEANVFEDEIGEEYFSNEMHNKIVDIENFDSHVQECKMEKIATKYENERCALDENPKQEELETFDNNPVNLQDDDSISPDDFVCPDMNFEANVKEDKIGKECSSNEMHNKILDIENFDSHEEECKMEKIATEYENERSSFDENPKEEELEKIDNNPVNLQNDDFISPDNTISPDMNFEANVEEDKIGEECSSNGMHNKIVVIENFDSHVEEWKMEKIATKYEDERSSLDENLKEEELEKIDKNPVNLQDGDFISSDDFISPDMNFGANVNEDNIGKECFLNEMQNKIVNIANLDSHAEECKMEKVATKHEDESTALDENPKEDELETFDNNPVNPEESPTNFKLETATAIPSQNLLRDNNFEYKPLDMASLTRASNKAMDSLERETKELIALLQNLEEENEEKFKEIEFQEKEITENVDEKSYEDNVIMGENSEEQQGKEISYQSETESKEIKRDNKCQKLNPAETTSDIGSEGIKLGNNEEQFDEIDIKQTVLNIIYAATSSECSNIQSEDRKFSCYEIEKMEALTEDPDDVDISQEMDFDDNRQEMKVKENASQIGGEGCANENHNNTEDMKRKLNNKSGYDVSRDIGEGATSTKENNDEGILARDILENIIVEEMENNNKENGENHADCMSQEIHFEAIVKEDKIEEEGSLNEIHNKIKDMKEKLNDELGCDAPREITGYMRDIGEEAYSESATSIKENDDGRILERDILENIFVEGNENNNKDNGENHDDFISQEMNFEVNVKEDKIGEDKNFDEDKIEEEGCANEMNNKMTDMESKLNIEPEYDVPRETNENTRDDKDEVHGEIASSTKDNGVRSNESILEQDILERKNAGEIENNDKMLKIRGDDDSLTVKNNGENHDYFISQQMNFEANVKEDKIGEEGSSNEIHKKIKDMERKLNNELDYDVLRETNEDMSDNEENIHNESACSTEENDDECILQRNILVNKNVEESENNNKMLKIRGDDDSLAVKDNGENHDDFISEDMHFDGETHEHISNSVQFVEEILEESLEELFNENLYTTIEKDGIEIDENTEENVFDENMYESVPQIPAIDANADEPKKNPLEMTKTKHLPLTKTIHDVLDSLADLFKGIPKKKRQKVHVSESDKSACLKKLAGQPQLKMFNQDTHESLDKQLNEFKEQQKIEIQQMVNRVYAQRERYDDSIELIDDKLMIVHKDTGELRELEKPKHIAYSDSDNNDYDTADEGACCSKPRKALDGEQSDVVKQQNSWKSIESDADGDEIVTTEKATDGSRDGKIFNFMENTPSKAPSIAAMNYKNPWYSIESGTDDEEQFHSLPPSSKSLNIFDNIHRDFFDKLSLDHLNFTPQDEDQIVQCSRSYTELRNLLIQLPAEEVFTQEERTLLESIKIGSSKTEDFPNLSQTEKHVQICQYTENNSKEVPVENTCEKEQHKESIASEHWYIGEENNEKKDNPYYKVLSNGVNVIFDAQRADVKTQTQDQEIQTEITLGTNSDFEHKNTEFKHQVESFQSQRNSSLDYSKNVPLKPDENIENYNSDILECNLEILDCNDGIVDNIMVNAEIHYEY
ncbi:repetitive organellar protein isoform X3 [Musca domestica]|uniref:Dynein axonemal assembly factor 1 homolog n=1 Tax=Musca domestica TaxID=7370 RepID=A0ABM3VJM9_MUSDO|nr:repetitive organellar protein isoform X3 [Musca domestica]